MRLQKLGLLVGLALLVALTSLMLVGMVAADDETEAACPDPIEYQVRFYDLNDIPIFSSATAATNAAGVYTDPTSGDWPQPTFSVPGGIRQKYFYCGGPYDPTDGYVTLAMFGDLYYAPSLFVESIVARNAQD